MRSLVLLALLLAAPLADAQDAYARAHRRYADLIRRPPLGRRFRGIQLLAATRDPRAIPVLAARYAKAKGHERYLIAWALGSYFRGDEHADALWRVGANHRKPSDGWLRFQTARAMAQRENPAELLELVRKGAPYSFARAAALEALAAARHHAGPALVVELLNGKLPQRQPGRGVLVESCAALLAAHAKERESDTWRAGCEALVRQLEDKRTAARTRLVVARHLARAFDVEHVVLEAWFWRSLLEMRTLPKKGGYTRSYEPRFGGLKGAGLRIAFLIDMSDSMLEPLAESEREDGVAGLVETRFDLARAYLEESLRDLPPDAHFAVIGFGERAFLLAATPALVPATEESVESAVRELRAVRPLPGGRGKPHGVLKGATNLHGALRAAFKLTPKGFVKRFAHCDPKALRDGVDTIFLLSDGKPTTDDFAEQDEYGGRHVRTDKESGATRTLDAPPGFAFYPGPYEEPLAIRADLARLNLFRKVEIHAIAMGEADAELLRAIAALGHGRFRTLGGP